MKGFLVSGLIAGLYALSASAAAVTRRGIAGGPGELATRDLYNANTNWNRTYAPAEPQQIHISITDNAQYAKVQFATLEEIKTPLFQYWPKGSQRKAVTIENGQNWAFVDNGTAHHTIYLHNLQTRPLKAATIYQYKVGTIDMSGNSTWSQSTFEFHTASKDDTTNFIATADLGLVNAVALPNLINLAKSHEYDFMTLSGDQAYDMADFNGTKGDDYMNMVQDLFANIPFIGGVGNHESAYNFSHWKNRFNNVPYQESNFVNNMQYSFNYKTLHIISFNTEIYFEGSAEEITTALNWFEEDLKQAQKNRKKQPWIIVMSHHPAYCTSYGSPTDMSCLTQTAIVRDGPIGPDGNATGGIEDLMLQYGVDVYLTGHRHNYERTYPVAKGKRTSTSYHNAPSYFEILVGNAGNYELTIPFNSTGPLPDWSASRYDGYGFSVVRATPTELEFTHYQSNLDGTLGSVIDHVVATKDSKFHALYHQVTQQHKTASEKKALKVLPLGNIHQEPCGNKYGDATYASQGRQSLEQRHAKFQTLLSQRRVPRTPWSEADIEWVLGHIAKMDSNNFQSNVGLGEREARIASRIVARRHYGFGHGIGRSGDISEVQPKAAGSSLLYKLTQYMVLDLLRICGLTKAAAAACVILPMATGMALTLSMRTVGSQRPRAKYVLWPRIDQKSCFKSIITAGYVPVVIPNVMEGDMVRTNLAAVQGKVHELGPENIVCIMSTTSCFAPRVPDRIIELAKICQEHDIPHVINNAYGLASQKCVNLVNEACRQGRVDLYIQSTDKNFLVPVGGSVVAGPQNEPIAALSQMYPGRASIAPIMDLFITLLEVGADGFLALLQERRENYAHLCHSLSLVAHNLGCRVLETPVNDVSLAMTLNLPTDTSATSVTFLGSMLFSRSVSGTRVVPPHTTKTISGYSFNGFMSHIDEYTPRLANAPTSYMTAAAAIGVKRQEIDVFVEKLQKLLGKTLSVNLTRGKFVQI
ncbi:hypothetical protein BZG36_03480 [Bifiguratus adelaidae]|uniref:Purple acid phosphatase n=1 Tax=Bifiguratus adelaidae TaxID=1938954 RepID=A0A261XWM3_9FUNG|nr:hypothetical protein BZG36_03480 [Bifiguratus adelaidae]